MQVLASRTYRYVNLDTLEDCEAEDTLFRLADGSMLLLVTSDAGDKRYVEIGSRDALIWLNEAQPLVGYDW